MQAGAYSDIATAHPLLKITPSKHGRNSYKAFYQRILSFLPQRGEGNRGAPPNEQLSSPPKLTKQKETSWDSPSMRITDPRCLLALYLTGIEFVFLLSLPFGLFGVGMKPLQNVASLIFLFRVTRLMGVAKRDLIWNQKTLKIGTCCGNCAAASVFWSWSWSRDTTAECRVIPSMETWLFPQMSSVTESDNSFVVIFP